MIISVCLGKNIFPSQRTTLSSWWAPGWISSRGEARIFQRRGGHNVSNNIVMAFSPRNIVGCLLKKGLQGGGHGHPRTPPPPSYALEFLTSYNNTSTTQFVFGQERSLFPHPKTRDNTGTSKEMNLSATFLVPKTYRKQGGWVGKNDTR